jgi:hypothetical protein
MGKAPNINAPGFSYLNPTQAEQQKGNEWASGFSSAGMGDSTNLTQAQIGSDLGTASQFANYNQGLAQQEFGDQLAASEQDQSGTLAGLLGGL